jgi:site-specific DNA-cytosine methylase
LIAALTTRAGNTQDDQQSQQLIVADKLRRAVTDHVRRLTPIECERLQGLPDDWTRVPDTAPDSRRYAGLGDAVTSPVAEWIGRRLLTHHQEKP